MNEATNGFKLNKKRVFSGRIISRSDWKDVKIEAVDMGGGCQRGKEDGDVGGFCSRDWAEEL